MVVRPRPWMTWVLHRAAVKKQRGTRPDPAVGGVGRHRSARQRVVDHVLVVADLPADKDNAAVGPAARVERRARGIGAAERHDHRFPLPAPQLDSIRLLVQAEGAQLAGRRRDVVDLLGRQQRLQEAGDEVVGQAHARRLDDDPVGALAPHADGPAATHDPDRRHLGSGHLEEARAGGAPPLALGFRRTLADVEDREDREHEVDEPDLPPAHAGHRLQRRATTKPSPTTANSSGWRTAATQKTWSPCSDVMKNWFRPGSWSDRRCPITSGSRASQATVLTNRSLFPRYSMKKLLANSAFP